MSITDELKEPFDPEVIHWRVGATNGEKTSGIGLAYVNARDVMKRFDDVCGDLWQVEYPFEGCCRVGVKIDDEWIWRSNGAGETNVEGEKGQYSDAFKRAAVLWGVGRYLYYLPNAWVPIKAQGRSHVLVNPPPLPKWALPGAGGSTSRILAHNKAVQDNIESITAIKRYITTNQLESAVEAMGELDEEVRVALSLASTKGGVWTTAENAVFTSNEWSEAAKSYYGN